MSGDYLGNRMRGGPMIKQKDLLVFMNANEFHDAIEDLEK